MPKCFVTGLELAINKSFLLDITAARKAVFDLRKRLHSVEGIFEQLSTIDKQKFYDSKKKKNKIRHERRLVCSTIATLFSESYPEAALFISWKEYSNRKKTVSHHKVTQNGGDKQ